MLCIICDFCSMISRDVLNFAHYMASPFVTFQQHFKPASVACQWHLDKLCPKPSYDVLNANIVQMRHILHMAGRNGAIW